MANVHENQVYRKGSFTPITLWDDQTGGMILSQDDIDVIESTCTTIRRVDLEEKTVGLGFGIERMKAIHKHLFQDVYAWAGQTRAFASRKLSNGKKTFANPDEFEEIYESIELDLLQNEWFDPSTKVSQSEFVERISDIYTRINNAHIFPDGNGRASREYINALSQEVGFYLDFSQASKKEWHEASKSAFQGDQSKIRRLFSKIATVNPIDLEVNANPVAEKLSEENVEARKVVKGLNHMSRLGIKLDSIPDESGIGGQKGDRSSKASAFRYQNSDLQP